MPDLLLDTHVWIWLINGDTTLGSKARATITRVTTHGRLLVSAISVWEVGMLEAKGRLIMAQPCLQWVQAALGVPGIVLAPLSLEIAIQSSRLPGTFPGDPADRILVATARVEGAAIVTRDRRMIQYGRQKLVQVVPV